MLQWHCVTYLQLGDSLTNSISKIMGALFAHANRSAKALECRLSYVRFTKNCKKNMQDGMS